MKHHFYIGAAILISGMSATLKGLPNSKREKAMQTEPQLFLDDHRGVYIPRDFALEVKRDCVSGVTEEQWAILEAGPDHEWYWDTWSEVEQNATVTDPEDGTVFHLCQNGPLWLVPSGYDNPEFFGD
jgi:hypothetical protein